MNPKITVYSDYWLGLGWTSKQKLGDRISQVIMQQQVTSYTGLWL